MPIIERPGHPEIFYQLDDFTDPWLDRPYILLQHGYGRSSKFWYRWVPILARHYRVIRPDLRGLGQSSRAFDLSTGLSADIYLQDVDAILEHAGAQTIHLVGESLGGIIGLIYSATRPDKIRTLSAISTPAFLNGDLVKRSRFGYTSWEEALRQMGPLGYAKAKNGADRFGSEVDPDLAEWFAAEQGKSDVEVLIAMQKLAPTIDTRPYLPSITAPTLALVPTSEAIVTLEQRKILRNGIRQLNLTEIESRGHNLHCTQADRCAREVLAFATRHDGITLEG
ncbi:alpha/beta fold hydrolase [Paracoccus saliphilus]|uniref:3-oxoadipate enol-lactonase n=1 Tax=Paracoccus saliphilus TaxID=405559 RepID=A0AA45W7V3_9RHOB|nr:alpha/beta hydrolase [Paracoccus saliphilus]WCR01552.1 alpha/beta hydrolase [Paracoccus saliphilus]SIT12484.1 3-oxoadipate enol-lactonase [Paracoccus saliphilus]